MKQVIIVLLGSQFSGIFKTCTLVLLQVGFINWLKDDIITGKNT